MIQNLDLLSFDTPEKEALAREHAKGIARGFWFATIFWLLIMALGRYKPI